MTGIWRLAPALTIAACAGCYGDAFRTMGSQVSVGRDAAGADAVSIATGDTASVTGDVAANDAGVAIDTGGILGTACNATPAAPPSSLGLDSFYQKYLSASGIPVVASGKVADLALQRTCAVTAAMTAMRSDVRQAMIDYKLRIAIIATTEALTDIPEYRDLPTASPQTDWSTSRGIGATPARPVSSTAEENVLCLPSNPNPSESTLVYTLARAVQLGVSQTVPAFDTVLRNGWLTSINSGLWENTSAATDPSEYWALGTLIWYNAAAEANPPNGLRNQINTRAELKNYDPALVGSFLMQYFAEVDLPVHCQ